MYLLTLFPYGRSSNNNKVLIPSIDESTIIKGLNQLIKQEHNHYELYAKNIKMVMTDEPCGSYKDGSIWEDMNWETELLATLKD